MAAATVDSTPSSVPASQYHGEGEDGNTRPMATNLVADDLPSDSMLSTCSDIPVYGEDGHSRPFKDIYDGEGKRMIIFVRHFFCGLCQDFLNALSSSISPADLASSKTPISLMIIGCGDPSLIKDYATRSNCAFPIYADPTRRLYDELGMSATFDAGPIKPEYQTSSSWSIVTKGIVQALSAGSSVLKGGDFKQIGGDFLFQDGKPTWCHRMRNTRDHSSTAEIRQLLEI